MVVSYLLVTVSCARHRSAPITYYITPGITPIAVLEAKDESHHAADGLTQAKAYAQTLVLQFAYATIGRDILEFDSVRWIWLFRVENGSTQGGT